jgi:uncharacterized membrane protein YgcG
MICIDIVDFTNTSAKLDDTEVSKLLTAFYARVDRLSARYGVDKIDIIGDAYVAVSQFANDAVAFCISTLHIAKTTFWNEKIPSLGVLHLRCAVHTGKVTGLVLDSVPFKYTLVGETVVKAKKLEAMAPPGQVNCSAATAKCLDPKRFRLVSLREDPECFLVQHTDDNEETVVHMKTMRFSSVRNDFITMFGFIPSEMRSMRPVFGPKTRLDAIHMAMEMCVELNYPTSIPAVLYTRTAVDVRVRLDFQKSEDEEFCVVMRCAFINEDTRSPSPTVPSSNEGRSSNNSSDGNNRSYSYSDSSNGNSESTPGGSNNSGSQSGGSNSGGSNHGHGGSSPDGNHSPALHNGASLDL